MNANLPAKIAALRQQRRQILTLPPEQALERILQSDAPAALVHSFPEQDFYFLVHDVGPEDALPLLALASDRQWEFLLDVEAWNRDRIDLAAVTRWLDRLHRADPRRTIRYLVEQKTEFLEFYLFRNLEVRIRETDQDPTEFGEDYFSQDSIFYVRPAGALLAENSDLSDIDRTRLRDFLLELVESLALQDHITYQKILLETVSVLPAEIEEEAFRLRNVRLSEKGLVPFDEAVGIYQPLRPADLAARSRKSAAPEAGQRAPLYPAEALPPDDAFSESLVQIEAAEMLQPLQAEFANLCNRIIAADRQTVRSRDDLRAVVRKAAGYLSIGLQAVEPDRSGDAGHSLNRRVARLRRHLFTDLFRVGFGRALALKWKAQHWLDQSWFAGQGLSLTFWGETWMGLLGGLLIKKPLYFDNFRSGVMYRDFRSLEEIETSAAELESVIALDRLLSRTGIQPRSLASQRFLTHKNLLLTLWAQAEMNLQTAGPLPLEAFRKFYDTLWQPGPPPRRLAPEAQTAFRQWLARRAGLPEEEVGAVVGRWMEALFQELEDEFANVSAADLDPRYILLFVIEP